MIVSAFAVPSMCIQGSMRVYRYKITHEKTYPENNKAANQATEKKRGKKELIPPITAYLVIWYSPEENLNEIKPKTG